MLLKQKSSSLPRNLALRTSSKLVIVFSKKVNLLFLLYLMDWRYYILHLIKQNYLLKAFLRTDLDSSGIYLPVFHSRTKLKLHISLTPNMIKKVITNLDSSEASVPDCIPVVVLQNGEPELSYILAELFNMVVKESCFPDCWKVSSVVPSSTSRCILVFFEKYGHPKKCAQKVLVTFFLYIFHLKTK